MLFRGVAGVWLSRQQTKRIWALGIAAALGLTAAACGSSSGATSAQGTSTSARGSGSGDSPIKVMTMVPVASQTVSFPEAKVAAAARVKAINAAGGIAGHPVQLDFCDTKADPNAEPACVRQAAADNDVAIVGALTIIPATYDVLKSTGIPLIGGWAILPQDFTTPNVYQYTSGVPGWFGGDMALLKQAGAKTYGIIECDSPACQNAAQTSTTFGNLGGLKQVAEQVNPVGSTNASAVVAKVVSAHPDGIVLAETTNDIPQVLTALQQAGYHGVLVTDTGALTPGAQKAAGSAANGLLVTSQVKPAADTTDPAVKQFLSEMTAEDPTAMTDQDAAVVWGSWYLFQQLGKLLKTVTPTSISDALNSLKEPLQTGIGAPFTTADKSPLADAPRLFSPTVFVEQAKDGKLVPYGTGELNFLSALGQ